MKKQVLPRYFTFFLIAAFISNIGTWIQFLAQGWLVAELSIDPFWSGFVGFCGGIPFLIFSFYSGVIADLIERRMVLFFTQCALSLIAVLSAFLVCFHYAAIWNIAILAFLAGLSTVISYPAYNGFIYDIVGKENTARAVSLNSMQFQLARMLGPVLALLVVGMIGIAGCFMVNSFSFIGVLFITRIISAPYLKKNNDDPKQSLTAFGKNVFQYIKEEKTIQLVLLSNCVTAIFMAPQITLLPVFVKENLHLGLFSLSWLLFSSALGSFLASLIVISFNNKVRNQSGGSVLASSAFAGASLLGLSITTQILFIHLFLFISGIFVSMVSVLGLSLIQTQVHPSYRGRILGLWIMCFQGMFPVGNLFLSLIAKWTSISIAWGIASLALMAACLILWLQFRKQDGVLKICIFGKLNSVI